MSRPTQVDAVVQWTDAVVAKTTMWLPFARTSRGEVGQLGQEWNGMEWNGMEWKEWNGMEAGWTNEWNGQQMEEEWIRSTN